MDGADGEFIEELAHLDIPGVSPDRKITRCFA